MNYKKKERKTAQTHRVPYARNQDYQKKCRFRVPKNQVIKEEETPSSTQTESTGGEEGSFC